MTTKEWKLDPEDRIKAVDAFKNGKKVIELKGIKFKMYKKSNVTSEMVDGKVVYVKKQYVVLHPADGRVVPVVNLRLS